MATNPIGNVIKAGEGLLQKAIVEKVMLMLIARAPFFGFAIVNPIVAYLVGHVVSILLDQGAFLANWVWIIVDNNLELKAEIKSKEGLAIVLKNGGDIAKAKAEMDKAADDLIHHSTDHIPHGV